MNKGTLLQLISNPNNISEGDLENLEEIVASYPYCQIAHLLIAKYTQDNESMLATQKIRRAASYTYDRLALRNLINNVAALPSAKKPAELALSTEKPESVPSEEPHHTEIISPVETSPSETEKSFFDEIDSSSEQPVDTSSSVNLNEEVGDIDPADMNESRAMELYNEGKPEKAIQIYRLLATQNPDKRTYYQNQLSIIIGEEVNLDPIPTTDTPSADSSPSIEEETPENINSYFENIDALDTGASNESTQGTNVYEDINEGKALGLYYDGKVEEAQEMYEKLMELYPDKKEYYQEQINTLISPTDSQQDSTPEIDITLTQPSLDTTISEEAEPSNNQSFFEGIEENSEPSPTNNSLSQTQPEIEIEQKEPETPPIDPPEEKPEPIIPQEEPVSTPESNQEEQASFFDSIVEDSSNQSEQSTTNNIQEPVTQPEPEPEPPKEEVITPPIETNNEVIAAEENSYEDESQAILLFNQGKNEEAIKIYESLIQKNPQKSSYYLSQIDVLKDSQTIIPNRSETHPILEENKLKVDPDQEEVSERLAIQLFNQGDEEKAVEVYEKLMRKFPEKRNYYASQIEILKS